jgi:hypothetical protein
MVVPNASGALCAPISGCHGWITHFSNQTFWLKTFLIAEVSSTKAGAPLPLELLPLAAAHWNSSWPTGALSWDRNSVPSVA